MVDLKALRRLVTESKKQGGFVTADDFPTPEPGGSSGFRENFKGRYGRDDS